MDLKSGVELLKDTFFEWRDDKASRLAAALAYYAAFSLAPLVIIVVGIAGFIFGEDVAGSYLLQQVESLIGQPGAEVFQTIIEGTEESSTSGLTVTIIGVGTLIFGATGVFAQLQDALNTIWGVTPKPGQGIWHTIRTRFASLTMILGIGFLLMVSLVISAILAAFSDYLHRLFPGAYFLSQAISFVVSFGVISLMFAMMYRYLPDVEIKWSDVWVGAAATAFLFAIGKFALGYYLGRQSFGSTYGAAGSILIILLWVYYSAQILLLGAEFTQVYARKYGSRIRPDDNVVPLTPEMRARQGIPRAETVEAINRTIEQKPASANNNQ